LDEGMGGGCTYYLSKHVFCNKSFRDQEIGYQDLTKEGKNDGNVIFDSHYVNIFHISIRQYHWQ
jgi:hypothetical protein